MLTFFDVSFFHHATIKSTATQYQSQHAQCFIDLLRLKPIVLHLESSPILEMITSQERSTKERRFGELAIIAVGTEFDAIINHHALSARSRVSIVFYHTRILTVVLALSLSKSVIPKSSTLRSDRNVDGSKNNRPDRGIMRCQDRHNMIIC